MKKEGMVSNVPTFSYRPVLPGARKKGAMWGVKTPLGREKNPPPRKPKLKRARNADSYTHQATYIA